MIILASGSPRRKQLLNEAGVEVAVEPADIDEHVAPHESPMDYALRMAIQKAYTCADRHRGEQVHIISADTSVVLGEEIMGKPVDAAEAAEMLGRLSGKVHRVLTGVCVLDVGRMQDRHFVSVTHVHFTSLSPERIRWYIGTGEPMDKAGAYGIQGHAAGFVSRIEGSYTNVVGLPVCETLEALHQLVKI